VYAPRATAVKGRALTGSRLPLAVDLAGVSFLDSAGLSALLSLRAQADRAGAQLGLVRASRLVPLLDRHVLAGRARAL